MVDDLRHIHPHGCCLTPVIENMGSKYDLDVSWSLVLGAVGGAEHPLGVDEGAATEDGAGAGAGAGPGPDQPRLPGVLIHLRAHTAHYLGGSLDQAAGAVSSVSYIM